MAQQCNGIRYSLLSVTELEICAIAFIRLHTRFQSIYLSVTFRFQLYTNLEIWFCQHGFEARSNKNAENMRFGFLAFTQNFVLDIFKVKTMTSFNFRSIPIPLIHTLPLEALFPLRCQLFCLVRIFEQKNKKELFKPSSNKTNDAKCLWIC